MNNWPRIANRSSQRTFWRNKLLCIVPNICGWEERNKFDPTMDNQIWWLMDKVVSTNMKYVDLPSDCDATKISSWRAWWLSLGSCSQMCMIFKWSLFVEGYPEKYLRTNIKYDSSQRLTKQSNYLRRKNIDKSIRNHLPLDNQPRCFSPLIHVNAKRITLFLSGRTTPPFPWIVQVTCRWDKGSQNNLTNKHVDVIVEVSRREGTPGFSTNLFGDLEIYEIL